MNESVRIKRGLLRLNRTTPDELAEYAGTEASVTRVFLDTPGLCIKQRSNSSYSNTADLMWVLTDRGRERLIENLRSLSAVRDPELDKERLDGLRRIERGIAELEEEISELESNKRKDPPFQAAQSRIRERLNALGVGIRSLGQWRPQPRDEFRLLSLRKRLAQLSS
jgi:hypothetical protein